MLEKISSFFKSRDDGSYAMSLISQGDCGVIYEYSEVLGGVKND